MMERKLPIIVIEGTEFIVDVAKEQLRERDRPENTLDIKKMSSKGFTKGYTFDYNVKTRNFPNERTDPRNDIKEIEIEDFCRIDPFGMALKYDISVEKVKISNDLELAIKQNNVVDQIWNKGGHPTLTIKGELFDIDFKTRKLRPQHDLNSKGINFHDFEEYYLSTEFGNGYVIPYNPKTRELQDYDDYSILEMPKDLILIIIPQLGELGKLQFGMHNNGRSITIDYLNSYSMHLESQTIAWEETNIKQCIRRNIMGQLRLPNQNIADRSATDCLYRIPTDLKRELPIHTIKGTDFIVDVNQLELREKDNPKNVIFIGDMEEMPREGYCFRYCSYRKTFDDRYWDQYVEIPDFVKLDPLGMMLKHNLSKDEIGKMTDFHLMINQEVYERLAHKNVLPTIDIANDIFHIDLDKRKLILKDDIGIKEISLSNLYYNFFPDDHVYAILYNTISKGIEDISILTREIPKDIIIVEIPFEGLLHPIWVNKKMGRENALDGVKIHGLQEHFIAKVIPWNAVKLAEAVKKMQELSMTNLPKARETHNTTTKKGRKM